MAKFSIMLFGIDSYTKNKMQLPYKLDAKSSDLAGCFNPDKLTVKDSYTMTEADKDALRMRDIVLLPVVEM